MLESFQPTPVVKVNRAVAEAETFGPQAGLTVLDTVQGVDDWHLYWTTLADFLRRDGNQDGAIEAYRQALNCQMNDSDRRFVRERLAQAMAG